MEDAARELLQHHVGVLADANIRSAGLRNIDQQAYRVDLRHAKEFTRSRVPGAVLRTRAGGTRAAGRDEGTGIDIAHRNHAGNRRPNALEFLHGDQAVEIGLGGPHVLFRGSDVGFRGLDQGLRRLVRGLRLVALLLGDGAAGQDGLVPLPGDALQFQIRPRLLEGGLGLPELLFRLRDAGPSLGHLLVEFGGFDDGHELAFFDTVAEIDEALL